MSAFTNSCSFEKSYSQRVAWRNAKFSDCAGAATDRQLTAGIARWARTNVSAGGLPFRIDVCEYLCESLNVGVAILEMYAKFWFLFPF